MQLIAGLGNPGEKYQDNPHNIGFRTLDQLMKALDLEGFQRRFNSEFQRTLENGQVTLMLKPETYMNRSGEAIAECARYFKIPSEKILVISDDLDLPAGKARLRVSGGHGGHNGLRSVIQCLGTDQFLRARIGIGRPDSSSSGKETSVSQYVLGKNGRNKSGTLSAGDGKGCGDAGPFCTPVTFPKHINQHPHSRSACNRARLRGGN